MRRGLDVIISLIRSDCLKEHLIGAEEQQQFGDLVRDMMQVSQADKFWGGHFRLMWDSQRILETPTLGMKDLISY